MIDLKGKPHIIRDNETIQSITAFEHVPDHLKKFEL
jgi:hypothetical protein